MRRLVSQRVAFVLSLGLCIAAVRAAGTPATPLPGPVVGQAAPDFTLTTVDGNRVRLGDYRGKVLVLNVWGSWCPPCRLETPDLNGEAGRDPKHVAFLGVDTTETADVVRAFVAAKGIPYPQAVAPSTGPFASAYAIRNYPTTFVIDPQGVLRARHADNLLPTAQLRAYIEAAQRGASAPLAGTFQARLDTLLDPTQYRFRGDSDTIHDSVTNADQAIANANALLDDAMEDPSRDHDLIKTQAEEETLRAAAIAALTPIASGDADHALLARLRGDEETALGHWSQADAAYAAALKIVPNDIQTLAGDAYALSHLGDDARVVRIDATIARLRPSPRSYVALARAEAKRRAFAQAEAAFATAQTLAATDPPLLAWTNLYYGRVETAAGNRAKAHAAFERAGRAAASIPSGDPRAVWYLEQAQEGSVALDVAQGGTPSLSLAPWTGPDLPGSVASTIKYRLVVTGRPRMQIALTASGLPAHWIGSFCFDRLCVPFHTSLVLPAGGVKVLEFQVVRTSSANVQPKVRIDAMRAGHTVARATMSIAR